MLANFNKARHIYLACGATDGRKSIDGLSALVKHEFKLDPFSGSLFLFCNKRKNCIKVLVWENNGFTLVMKRLAQGKFQWPKNQDEIKQLSRQQFRWLLEGISIIQPKALGKVSAGEL